MLIFPLSTVRVPQEAGIPPVARNSALFWAKTRYVLALPPVEFTLSMLGSTSAIRLTISVRLASCASFVFPLASASVSWGICVSPILFSWILASATNSLAAVRSGAIDSKLPSWMVPLAKPIWLKSRDSTESAIFGRALLDTSSKTRTAFLAAFTSDP